MRLVLLILSLLCLSVNLKANEQPYIEVITSDEFPVTSIEDLKKQGIKIKVLNFDDSKRMITQLESGLPNQEAAAKKVMQHRLKKWGMRLSKTYLHTLFRPSSSALNMA